MSTTTPTRTPLLSKSTFVRGNNCLKSLYLYKNHYELHTKPSPLKETILAQGNLVGLLARELFPNGYDASVTPPYDYTSSIEKTNDVLQNGEKIIYEAGFCFDNLYAALDILVIKEDGWYVYEVKSSRSVKSYQYLDVALQLYLLRGLGLPVKRVHIVHVKKDFRKHGPISPIEFFVVNDATSIAESLQEQVKTKLTEMTAMLLKGEEPVVSLGPHCQREPACDFWGHCSKNIQETKYPITNISHLGSKKWDFINEGIYCQSQLTASHKLSETQQVQVKATLTKTSPLPQLNKLKSFLNTIRYPIAFFDFETFDTIVPLFDGISSKEVIPFQYSLHLMQADGQVSHYCYLGDGKSDPRPKLVEQLVEELKDVATVLCYNMTFEKTRLKELAQLFPRHKQALNDICLKLVDLIIPFRKRYVYHHQMNGSASIKNVLPSFLPHLSYKNLLIGEGKAASKNYLRLFEEEDEKTIREIKTGLLAYCELDTWGMVELYRYLKHLCEGDNA